MKRVLPDSIGVLLAPLLIPLLLIAALLSIPYTLAMAWFERGREDRFHARLRASSRFLDWPVVAERLQRGEGTFLVEHANKQGARFWWSAEDVLALAPTAPPLDSGYDFICPDPRHAFVSWCFARYTSPASGSALLTRPDRDFPPLITNGYLSSCFPNARAVLTILAHPSA